MLTRRFSAERTEGIYPGLELGCFPGADGRFFRCGRWSTDTSSRTTPQEPYGKKIQTIEALNHRSSHLDD